MRIYIKLFKLFMEKLALHPFMMQFVTMLLVFYVVYLTFDLIKGKWF